jgi:hypothetical protein
MAPASLWRNFTGLAKTNTTGPIRVVDYVRTVPTMSALRSSTAAPRRARGLRRKGTTMGSPGLSAGSGALVALGIGTGLPATPSVASAEPSNFRFVLGDPARRA